MGGRASSVIDHYIFSDIPSQVKLTFNLHVM